MNILFIGVNQRYINATNYHYPSILNRIGNLLCFGPGFVSEDEIKKGVDQFLKTKAKPDIIVIAAQCVVNKDAFSFNKSLQRYTYVFNSAQVTGKFLSDTEDFCKNNKARVVCLITDIDPHVTPQYMINHLIAQGSYFIGWGNGFLNAHDDMFSLMNEEYVQRKIQKGFQVGLLDFFATEFSDRMINLGHFVADQEFYWGNLSARKYDVSVPGSSYTRRKNIIDLIKKNKNFSIPQNRIKYFLKIMDRVGIKTYSNFYLVNLYNFLFQMELSTSKICITEGGGNNYPVRKFFEIPASGALMACWPAIGLKNLGYKHNENCIYLNSSDDIFELIADVKIDLPKYQHIAALGRKHTLDHHSASARSNQLKESFEKILSNNFSGSFWDDGIYKLS
jgi:hypothetical protein